MPTNVGPWRLGERLGSGGVADVYAATSEPGGKTVALKVLRPDQALRPEVRAAFAYEAALARRCIHPNLIPLVAADLDHAPPWLAFEFVGGPTLAAVLRASGPLPPALATAVVIDAACGLAAAHARGVLHCDLKPENLLLGPDGRARLADLGAAAYEPFHDPRRRRPAEAEEGTKTRAPSFTMAYASPEQLLGKDLDPTSDLYALGLVLHEAVTGQQVCSAAEPLEALLQRRRLPDGLPLLARPGPGLAPLLDHLLAGLLPFRREERRYRTAMALLVQLDYMIGAGDLTLPESDDVRERHRIEQGDAGTWRVGPGPLAGWPLISRPC